ncbi:T9SS type A sorting domain-containing protein [Ilyomonas limi]|uniref:T9SS type A sorting domain-containing protein n=1 Tax=Ilyomonas limi TaxID=2575867 RepID=A0A4U3KYT7_9BACT|nr:T9SS type A sorting domain-containing protein [Ilyomonas limi]TKK67808.1 T9SS type A sorting domain-containing protein [Ilyomonas limi]
MKKTLLILVRHLKTLLTALVFVCAGFAVSSFTFHAHSESAKVEVIKCYPNPATSIVNFEFQKNIDKSYVLQVYSFVGKKMVETPVVNNKITITLTDFNRGIYVYQLRDKSGATVVAGKFQVIK